MIQQRRLNSFNRSDSGRFHRQAGLGMISIFIIVAVVIFFGLFAFKIGPSYAEYWTISRVADEIAVDDALLRGGSRKKVMQRIANGFRNNNLWDVRPEETVALVKDGERGYALHISYEREAKLFGNIFITTKFDREAGNGAP